MSNNITVNQVIDELVSEGTTITCEHLDTVKVKASRRATISTLVKGLKNFFLKGTMKTRSLRTVSISLYLLLIQPVLSTFIHMTIPAQCLYLFPLVE